jgi:acyl-CoA synthetase (AMP-forming)/AMP-acid ligase II
MVREDRPVTIPGLLAAAQRWGERVALVDHGVELTFSGLLDATREFGAGLTRGGVGRGDRVAIWAPNSAAWIIALLGTAQVGGVVVPINTRWKGREAAKVLARSSARVLVTVGAFLGNDYVEMLRASDIELPHLESTILVDDEVTAPGRMLSETLSLSAFVSGLTTSELNDLERSGRLVRGEDPADIMFTSGTSGEPKGAVRTHERSIMMAFDWLAMTGLREGDRYLMVNPYFHIFGLQAGILACLAAGATMYPEPVFEPDAVLAKVETEKISVLPGPPTLYRSLLGSPRLQDFDLSTLRISVTGSSDIPADLIESMQSDLPFSTVISAYGMTETGTITSTCIGDPLDVIATTVGYPRPDFDVRLVDLQGADVEAGQSGEIVVRSPSRMSYYLDDPDGTAAVLSTDGWMRTGDCGVQDPSGRFKIVGRLKDTLIVGGFNVYPAEVENMMRRHPGIHDAAVIGLPDERLGEVPMAFIILRAGVTVSESEVVAWCRKEMANYKVPRRVEIVEEFPLNASGKVQKEELRASRTTH